MPDLATANQRLAELADRAPTVLASRHWAKPGIQVPEEVKGGLTRAAAELSVYTCWEPIKLPVNTTSKTQRPQSAILKIGLGSNLLK